MSKRKGVVESETIINIVLAREEDTTDAQGRELVDAPRGQGPEIGWVRSGGVWQDPDALPDEEQEARTREGERANLARSASVIAVRRLAERLVRDGDAGDELLRVVGPLLRPWTVGEDVAIGDVREFGGEAYECIQAHTTQADWEPPDVPALWTPHRPAGEVTVWVQPTGSHDAYMMGEHVHYPTETDPVYRSEIDHNVWDPDTYGWVEVT